MSVVKVHRLAVVGDNQDELEKRFAAARHIADSFPGFEVLSCGVPWMRAATISW